MPMAFSVYVLIYLVIALLGSLLSASYLSGIQDRISADAREVHGLYLYDPESDRLVEARQIIRYTDDDPTNPLVLYVEDSHDNSPTNVLDPLALGPSVQAHDLSRYPDQQDIPGTTFTLETSDGMLMAESDPSFGYLIACDAIPLYDQKARETWSLQSGEDIANLASGSNLGPAISPIGYYLQTLPSMEARIAETALGAATVLVFPLWFGVCIYLAGRRFYAKRIKPAVTVFDAATAKIAEQDLDFTVTYDRADEMGRLAASFETMRASLAHTQGIPWRTAEERRHLNAAFAHDLRTPLTILHGKLELLQARVDNGTVDPEHLAQDCRTLLAQVERLELYVAAMSSVRRLEDRKISREPVNARALAQALDDAGTQLCRQAGIAFTWESIMPSDAQFLIDRAAVVEVIENLIGNAARYAASRVSACVAAEPDSSTRPRYVVLTIKDDGPGFSTDALAQALEPFFSESKAEGHFGLGLNMANLLCQKHDGTLELANPPDGGACVIARFGCSSA